MFVAGGDFWLGLEKLHLLTNQAYISYTMWITAIDKDHIPHTTVLITAKISSEESGYELHYKSERVR